MSKEKQIEEMARDVCNSIVWDQDGYATVECLATAKRLRLKGYCKQEWIGVDERLPESGVHCLVACAVKRIDGTYRQYVCDGYYAEKFKHLACGVDDDCVSDYNEENDEYYIAEGWYEIINNWDDYGFVAIDDAVTHWMPLPEAPKMKGGK